MSKTSPATNPILILSSTSIAAWLSYKWSMPSPYMCIITCYILTNIYAHEIYLKTTERITGALLGIFILNLIVSIGSNFILIQQALFLIAILSCFYLYFIRFRPYAMLICSIVLAFTMAAELNSSASFALSLGESWTLDVLLGSAIAVSTNLLVKSWKDIGRVAPIDNIRFEIELLTTSLKQRSSFRKSFIWDLEALIKSIRIILIFFVVVVVNQLAGLQSLTVQALIGAAVVSIQLTFEHSHTKFFHRVFGACLGVLFSLSTLQAIHYYQLQINWVWILEGWLCIYLLLMWWQPPRKYLFFQAGLVTIMLLTGINGAHVQSIDIAWQRTLGNAEGGIISLICIVLSDRLFKFNEDPDG